MPDQASDAAPVLVEPSASNLPTVPRKQRVERFEISIPKHQSPSAMPEIQRTATFRHSSEAALQVPFPIAPIHERARAGFLDLALLLFTYGGMVALFRALGGQIGFNKIDVIVTVATLALFYTQYFALFTVFGGSTPGMMVRGLRAVSLDGSVPTFRQMAWRSLGYVLSAGTFFLGFLWALWDEDHLCWQDRISRTYLTLIDNLTGGNPPPTADRR